ncbi:MAG: hypothetical protein ABIQ95_03825 [Bdellovibrionia bacterium]
MNFFRKFLIISVSLLSFDIPSLSWADSSLSRRNSNQELAESFPLFPLNSEENERVYFSVVLNDAQNHVSGKIQEKLKLYQGVVQKKILPGNHASHQIELADHYKELLGAVRDATPAGSQARADSEAKLILAAEEYENQVRKKNLSKSQGFFESEPEVVGSYKLLSSKFSTHVAAVNSEHSAYVAAAAKYAEHSKNYAELVAQMAAHPKLRASYDVLAKSHRVMLEEYHKALGYKGPPVEHAIHPVKAIPLQTRKSISAGNDICRRSSLSATPVGVVALQEQVVKLAKIFKVETDLISRPEVAKAAVAVNEDRTSDNLPLNNPKLKREPIRVNSNITEELSNKADRLVNQHNELKTLKSNQVKSEALALYAANKTSELHQQIAKFAQQHGLTKEWEAKWQGKISARSNYLVENAKVGITAKTEEDLKHSHDRELATLNQDIKNSIQNEKAKGLVTDFNKEIGQANDQIHNLSSAQIEERQRKLLQFQTDAEGLLRDRENGSLKQRHAETLNELIENSKKPQIALANILPVKKEQQITRENLDRMQNAQADIQSRKVSLGSLSSTFTSLPLEERKEIERSINQAHGKFDQLNSRITAAYNKSPSDKSLVDRLEKEKELEAEKIRTAALQTIDKVTYRHIQGKLENFLMDSVTEYPYKDPVLKRTIKNNRPDIAANLKKVSENLEASYSQKQCGKADEGRTIDLGAVKGASKGFSVQFHAMCSAGNKLIIPHSITFNGQTSELSVAKATMKSVQHAFDPKTSDHLAHIEKKSSGALAMEVSPTESPKKIKPQTNQKINTFDKNDYQVEAESNLERKIPSLGIYGKNKIEEASYSPEVLTNGQGVQYRNGLQKFNGISLNDRFDDLIANVSPKNRGLLNNSASRAKCSKQILNQVARMNAQGIIHRDIKPANVLMNDSGNCIVMDFGSAAWVDQDGTGEKRVVLNGYNHTQEYLRWHTSKGELNYGTSKPNLSSQSKDFQDYENFEKKLMEETKGKGIILKPGETPEQAILNKAPEEDRARFDKFVSRSNDQFQTGIVVAQMLSKNRAATLMLTRALRDPSVKVEEKERTIDKFFTDNVKDIIDKRLIETAKSMLKTFDGSNKKAQDAASKLLSPNGLEKLKLNDQSGTFMRAGDSKVRTASPLTPPISP